MKLSRSIFRLNGHVKKPFNQLRADAVPIDKVFLQSLVGGGNKYTFDEHGNVTGIVGIPGDDDAIDVNG